MASSLRRRIFGGNKHEDEPAKAEEVRLAPVSKIVTDFKHYKPKSRKRRNGFIFALGGLFGLVAAGVFAGRNDLIANFPDEFSMDGLLDVLPANFISDARDLQVFFLTICYCRTTWWFARC